MAENSKIEWTHHTVNFWQGCTKVSPACSNCYAERQDARFHGQMASHWGPDAPRLVRVVAAAREAMRFERRAVAEGRRFRVFTNSMADFFEDRRDLDQARLEALDVMRLTPHLDWLILTKRPKQIPQLLSHAEVDAPGTGLSDWIRAWLWGEPPKNVWLGTTVENQHQADKRIPALLQVPAAVRFLSCEPLLGAVDLREVAPWDDFFTDCLDTPDPAFRVHWVIVGGESGPKARPMHPDWARVLRDQCAASGVPFLLKQLGEWGPSAEDMVTGEPRYRVFRDANHWWAKGQGWMRLGDILLDANGMHCHSFGHIQKGVPPFTALRRVGKKTAGRMLDGQLHDGYPEVHP